MGDIVRPGSVPMKLSAEIIGTAPVERVDVLHGTQVVKTVRPYAASDLGGRVRVLWQGAEYRGRGRETMWHGTLTLKANRFARFAQVNFLNPERQARETVPGISLNWDSVTTGNLAGLDLWLDEAASGTLDIKTNVVSGIVDLSALSDKCRDVRRRWLGPPDQGLSPARVRLEPACVARTHGGIFGQRGPAGISAGDAGGRASGLVKSDIPNSVTTFGERLSRDVCFGSKADMVPADWHVRFTLKSGHRAEINQSSVLTAGLQASTSIPGPRAHEFKVGTQVGTAGLASGAFADQSAA